MAVEKFTSRWQTRALLLLGSHVLGSRPGSLWCWNRTHFFGRATSEFTMEKALNGLSTWHHHCGKEAWVWCFTTSTHAKRVTNVEVMNNYCCKVWWSLITTVCDAVQSFQCCSDLTLQDVADRLSKGFKLESEISRPDFSFRRNHN